MAVVGNQLLLENLETVRNDLGFESLSELVLFGLILLEVCLDELIEHIVNLQINTPVGKLSTQVLLNPDKIPHPKDK